MTRLLLILIICLPNYSLANVLTLELPEAQKLGFKWDRIMEGGIKLYMPETIEKKWKVRSYVAEFILWDQSVFMLTSHINDKVLAEGIFLGFPDSNQSGGDTKILVHYFTENGFSQRTYKLPTVGELERFGSYQGE
ncbi:MAG: hypothetical protein ABJH28_10105 [Paraglaciecola sp.]|uniref:hypothetical protein n=1 Tax=Paraglaciecola sp. TaxID=1920173 RepID=UPI003266C369